jgi:ubiquinone/menaquinone biosynthesis C-methylase UbiE
MEPFISQIRFRVVDIVKAPSGFLILNVATRTGRQAAAFGTQGYTVIGIDLSTDMLRIAKKKPLLCHR